MSNWKVEALIHLLVVSLASSAPDHRARHNHHNNRQNNKKSAEFQPALQHEDYRGNIPKHIFALLAANSVMHRNQSNDENAADDSPKINDLDFDRGNQIDEDDSTASDDAQNCPKCKKNGNSAKMSQEDINKLRIEYVKNEILNKLRMVERPVKKTMTKALPEPVQDGHTMEVVKKSVEGEETSTENISVEEYFAKTTQKIIFLSQEVEKCNQLKSDSSKKPSLCYSFKIPQDVDVKTITSAQIWLFKDPNNLDSGVNQTLLVSEFVGDRLEHLTFADTNSNNRGWEKIDIMTNFDVWIEKRQLDHVIQIKCDTCTSGFLPISTQSDTKPFIVIDTSSQKSVSRQRRSMDCGPGSTECCRDVLYIDFEEIGWSDWIIFPKGYHAYFCRGTCSRISSIQKAGSDHAMAVQRLLHSPKKKKDSYNELVPCCTATKYSPLNIIFLDLNGSATNTILPNMIVESCGCS